MSHVVVHPRSRTNPTDKYLVVEYTVWSNAYKYVHVGTLNPEDWPSFDTFSAACDAAEDIDLGPCNSRAYRGEANVDKVVSVELTIAERAYLRGMLNERILAMSRPGARVHGQLASVDKDAERILDKLSKTVPQ